MNPLQAGWYRSGSMSVVIALASLASACANVEAPPGSGPDFDPPAVLERFPAPGAVVPGLDEDAWLRFDEPIQSPRNLERGLDLSPAWDWKFNPRRSGFSVRPREGWQPGVIYHVRVPRGVSDLLRNTTRESIEWTFSTGPEISETRIDGTIYDRIQGAGVRDARILFLPPDSIPYSTVSDTGGVFSMRSLPPGEYVVLGFLDQNRNRRLDRDMETYDSALVSLPESTSRHALDLWMIPPDSTPPVLVGAVAFDTITVVLEFDDPLEPEAPLDSVRISVVPEFGGAEIRVVDLRVGQPGPQADLPAGRAAPGGQPPDSLRDDEEPEIRTDTLNILEEVEAADSLPGAADSISAATDSIAVADSLAVGGRERGEPGQPGQPGRPGLASTEARERPFPFLIVTLEQALTEDTFRVAVTGVSNLRGLTGGGDTTFVYVAPLPALAPADSDGGPPAGPAAVEDSTGVLPGQRPPVSPRQKRDERR
jgi:hypothetical protein